RLAEAHRLREAGSSFSEIAQALAIGRATVSRALTATSVPDPTTRRPISTEERACGLRPSTERQRPAPGSLTVPNSAEETVPLTAEGHRRVTSSGSCLVKILTGRDIANPRLPGLHRLPDRPPPDRFDRHRSGLDRSVLSIPRT